MSKMVEINFKPDRGTLRSFGFIALFGFGMLAVMAWTESFLFSFELGNTRIIITSIFALLAIYSVIASLIYPPANRWVFVGLSIITFPIGVVLSYLIMAVLFFGLFGLIATLMRIFGYDPMERKHDADAASYWHDARPPRPHADYFKQY